MTKISNQYSLTNVLFADAVNGRVGIGTASPTSALEISQPQYSFITLTGTNATQVQMNIGVNQVTQGAYLGSVSNHFLAIQTNSIERFRITSAGNVGIGVIPSAWWNEFKAIQVGTVGSLAGGSGVTNLGHNFYFDGTNSIYLTTSNASLYQQNAGNHIFSTAPSGTAGANVTFTERMRITSGGFVTITNTQADLLVNSTSTSQYGRILFQENGAEKGGIEYINSAFGDTARRNKLELFNSGGIAFITQGTFSAPQVLITSGGNVLIGTTTVSEKLSVGGGIITFGTSAVVYIGARDGSVNYAWYAENSSFLYFYNSGTNSVTGQFARTTGVYTPLSDINKKKDFEQSTIGLNEVLQLKPTLYRMKTDDGLSAKELGFIAQEVNEYIPQAYVESGEGDKKFIGLNQMPLIAALTKSIQELSAQSSEQQLQINELKALLNA